MVSPYAKLPSSDHWPGLGLENGEHIVGADGVGINIISATLACNTAQTVAELMAAAPNTGAGAACGPIVHSLGQAPTWVTLHQKATPAAVTGFGAHVGFQYVTADNSAVYVFAKTWTGVVPAGVNVRVYAAP